MKIFLKIWISFGLPLGNLQQNENFSNLLDNLIQYLRLLSKSKEFC
ncbi:hypothetical protein LEP1GSC132_3980 [Leptospira kirschneri str. 200803703]|nr:hypothetical protein LEP1GSC064_3808 [Leptospira kirschneri serovar Grippotyphosa str. Moskva]EMJ99084.1 hypothetical protein LEP1GSC176_0075 [Leptospira kirschneri str. MMD1493]EMN25746.1 hypothetical protein LEP1GSC065_3005 [Leptospira kirschneri serovar Sokoine str. RM1]EMO66656.1 hypothetical protein LEP1GSC132_3980 [Leptospira kirschneri str. 200803703]EMO77348.1 hypothetical protein LEP1GSC127_3165 [Leptospira kirschneri str. 200801925]